MLTPNISLLASTPSGEGLSTLLSADDAAFVNGVFADSASLTQNTTGAKDLAFQLPGRKIEIVPVGLYFYASYLFVACSIFGWGEEFFSHLFLSCADGEHAGTFERQRFRDQYRQRVAWKGLPSGARRR